ncbi:MAG TPA: glycosyltransferase [Bdellovibrionota bacterium]|nr:glycosyltransferase [Bdellovibrionota bacterium]
MKIVLFHPALLPPKDYGGVERMVCWLAKGLVERGHEVHVAALAGSQLPRGARLIAIEPGRPSAVDLLPRLPAGVDLVHFMAPPESEAVARLPAPALLTVHGNGKPGERFPRNTVFLSADHARRHGAEAFIHNGIDPEEVEFRGAGRADWYLFLSKTSWRVKNLAGAMRHCRRAGAKLMIAGGHRPWSLRARAALTPGFSWAGPVGGRKKAELLSSARALLFPVIWDEPFGLVVVEALMAGTPVIASPRGSLPELIGPEVGALPKSEEEWEAALREPFARDPERCRSWATERFHYSVMASGYESAYDRVLAGEAIQPREPSCT